MESVIKAVVMGKELDCQRLEWIVWVTVMEVCRRVFVEVLEAIDLQLAG